MGVVKHRLKNKNIFGEDFRYELSGSKTELKLESSRCERKTLVAPGTVENQLKLGSLIPFYGLSEGAGSASRK